MGDRCASSTLSLSSGTSPSSRAACCTACSSLWSGRGRSRRHTPRRSRGSACCRSGRGPRRGGMEGRRGGRVAGGQPEIVSAREKVRLSLPSRDGQTELSFPSGDTDSNSNTDGALILTTRRSLQSWRQQIQSMKRKKSKYFQN